MAATMSAATRNPGSFRDPCGFVFSRDGVVYRQVSGRYAADYGRLMSSGLYGELVARGWLLRHEERDLGLSFSPNAHKVLLPEQLDFVSHPYEWCFEQWQDAALTTLRVQRLALEFGMTLKDANTYNVQLHAARATLIDSLSFETYVPDRPWVAYRQFCQHFLAPLALMSRVDERLGQLFRSHVDGLPLDLVSRLLPWNTWLTPGMGLHLHAHARAERRSSRRTRHTRAVSTSPPAMSLDALRALIDHLESTVAGLRIRRARTEWDDYYLANHNYGDAGLAAKAAAVGELLGTLSGQQVWDLGANDGRFGRVALACGAKTVVAWDSDPNCVASAYRGVTAAKTAGFVPLWLDLANPSPAMGWENRERASFLDRGPADMVLALGLIHHLALSQGIPLARISSFLRRAGRRVIVEWVPKQDSQAQKLLATRDDIFGDYETAPFEREFTREFRILRRMPVEGTCRTLYLLESRGESAWNGAPGIPG